MKALAAQKYAEQLDAGSEWAIKFGLRHVCGFTDADSCKRKCDRADNVLGLAPRPSAWRPGLRMRRTRRVVNPFLIPIGPSP
jgi:hypothetical protein